MLERNGARWIMMADGLGHGQFAAEASEQAVQIFESSRLDTVAASMDEIHAGLRATRGAAVAVAEIRGCNVNFCGLGNISAVIQSAGRVHPHGLAERNSRPTGANVQQFTYKRNRGRF